MSVSYYPVQEVAFGGVIKGVQNVSIDFDSKKTEFFEFGKDSRIGYASLENPTVSAKIEYVLNKGVSNNSIFQNFLTPNIQSKPCVLNFKTAQMTLVSGEITNYSLKGQVGALLLAEVDILGLDAKYSTSTSSPVPPSQTGVFSPTKLSLGNIPLRSFSVNISVPKKIVYSLGNGPEFFNFGKPKISFEAEIILGADQSALPETYQIELKSDSTIIFKYQSSNQIKLEKHSTQTSTSDIGVVRATYEGEIMNPTDVAINY